MIDPSLAAVLRSKYTIRYFYLVNGLALTLTLAMLIATVQATEPNSVLRDTATNFFGNFASAISMLLLIYTFYVLVTPPGLRNAEVIPLRSAEIAEGIIDLRINATDYWFLGRSGTYFALEVLPKLDELARSERRHTTIRMVLPDIASNSNAIRYASIKNGLGEEADNNTLPANVAVTIARAIDYASRNPFLKLEIGLTATLPSIRYDISNRGALLTRDAKHLPAILVNSGNAYFEMFKDVVESELAQAKKIKWDQTSIALHGGSTISIQVVRDSLSNFPEISSEAMELAERLLENRQHRYGK